MSFTPNSKKKVFFENIKKNLNYESVLDIAFLSKISVVGKTEQLGAKNIDPIIL